MSVMPVGMRIEPGKFIFPPRKRDGEQYNWAQLLDGNIWKLQMGVHFTSTPKSFIKRFKNECKNRGHNYSCLIERDPETGEENGFVYIQYGPALSEQELADRNNRRFKISETMKKRYSTANS